MDDAKKRVQHALNWAVEVCEKHGIDPFTGTFGPTTAEAEAQSAAVAARRERGKKWVEALAVEISAGTGTVHLLAAYGAAKTLCN